MNKYKTDKSISMVAEMQSFIKAQDRRRLLIVETLLGSGWDPDAVYGNLRKSMIRDVEEFDYLTRGHDYCKERFNSKDGLIAFRNTYLEFVEFHDRLYDGIELDFVSKILKKDFDALPERILVETRDLLLLNILIDRFHSVITTNFKPLIRLNGGRIKEERGLSHSEYLDMFTPSMGMFVSEYKSTHLSYLGETDGAKRTRLFEELMDKYHLGSENLARRRLASEFPGSQDSRFRLTQKKEWKPETDVELRAFGDLVNFDNYFELLHFKRLEGIAGVGLRYYLMLELKRKGKIEDIDNLLLPKNERLMLELLEDRIKTVANRFSIEKMPLYRQTTAVTCGPSSLMMLENYLDGRQMNKKRELSLYDQVKVEELNGCYDPLIALTAKRDGFRVRLLISSKEVFGKLEEIPDSKFEELEDSFGGASHVSVVKVIGNYIDYMNKARSEEVEVELVHVTAETLVNEIKDGYIPIPNVLLGSIQHMVVVNGYDMGRGTFDLSDPIRGRIRLASKRLNSDMQIPWGGVVVSISDFLEKGMVMGKIKDAMVELHALETTIGYLDTG